MFTPKFFAVGAALLLPITPSYDPVKTSSGVLDGWKELNTSVLIDGANQESGRTGTVRAPGIAAAQQPDSDRLRVSTCRCGIYKRSSTVQACINILPFNSHLLGSQSKLSCAFGAFTQSTAARRSPRVDEAHLPLHSPGWDRTITELPYNPLLFDDRD